MKERGAKEREDTVEEIISLTFIKISGLVCILSNTAISSLDPRPSYT